MVAVYTLCLAVRGIPQWLCMITTISFNPIKINQNDLEHIARQHTYKEDAAPQRIWCNADISIVITLFF
jgi:hypothetical protein